MVVVPFSINGYASVYISAIALLSIIGVCLRIPGAEFLLIAISLCLPAGWIGTSGLEFPEVNKILVSYGRFTQFIIPITGFYLLLDNHFRIKKHLLLLTLGVIFVGLLETLLTSETKDIHILLSIIGYCYAFMLICYFDKKIEMKDVFFYIDVLFLVSLAYGISEFLFRESPYQYITDATTPLNAIGRARGILGHPLYLSGLALIYQSAIFIRYLLLKKFGYIQEVLCITMALIVVSRTTVIVLLLEYILFVVLTRGYKSIKFWISNILFIIGGVFFIVKYADSIIIDLVARFIEGNFDHRESAFETVFLLFIDNPLGVGYTNIMDRIAKGGYGTLGFDSDFSTVDNLFLSQLAAYGVFSIIKIIFYFYFLIDSYKVRREKPLMFRVVLFLYFPILIESFSFDWDSSIFMCMLLYGLIGFLYRYFENTKMPNYRGNDVESITQSQS